VLADALLVPAVFAFLDILKQGNKSENRTAH